MVRRFHPLRMKGTFEWRVEQQMRRQSEGYLAADWYDRVGWTRDAVPSLRHVLVYGERSIAGNCHADAPQTLEVCRRSQDGLFHDALVLLKFSLFDESIPPTRPESARAAKPSASVTSGIDLRCT